MSDDLPPSMFEGEEGRDDHYYDHADYWDDVAHNFNEQNDTEISGYDFFHDVADALENAHYGEGDGFSFGDWVDGMTIDEESIYYDEEGNIHFSFDFDIESGGEHYEGSRGV